MTEQTDHAERRDRTQRFVVKALTVAAALTEAITDGIRAGIAESGYLASPGDPLAPERVTVPAQAPAPRTGAHAALWGAVRDASVIDVGTAEELQRCGLDLVTEFTPERDDQPRRPLRWRNPGMHDTSGVLVESGADAADMAVLRSVANRLAPALAAENAERHAARLARDEAQRLDALARRGLDADGNDLPGVERPSKLGSVESICLHAGAPAVVLGDPDGAETLAQVATPVDMGRAVPAVLTVPPPSAIGHGVPLVLDENGGTRKAFTSCPICYRQRHTLDQANECAAVVADHTQGDPDAYAADVAEVHAVEIVAGQS